MFIYFSNQLELMDDENSLSDDATCSEGRGLAGSLSVHAALITICCGAWLDWRLPLAYVDMYIHTSICIYIIIYIII